MIYCVIQLITTHNVNHFRSVKMITTKDEYMVGFLKISKNCLPIDIKSENDLWLKITIIERHDLATKDEITKKELFICVIRVWQSSVIIIRYDKDELLCWFILWQGSAIFNQN